jgi:hypothetical protein
MSVSYRGFASGRVIEMLKCTVKDHSLV